MKNALRLGQLARIDIFVHWTFIVLLVGLFGFYLYRGMGLLSALAGIAVVLLVFGCVILHELGHALAARRYGIATADITMYPIGGVARLTRMPREPKQELVIALAGPAVNLAIAAALFVLNGWLNVPTQLDAVLASETDVLGTLMWVNLGLAFFNLIPAFPMDGGRILRAGLATQLSYRRATLIAAFVGQVLAGVFLIYAAFTFNVILALVAIFVFAAARQEAEVTKGW
ncbi:MAG: site-2 protease family protein [Bacteroidota bacterium]